MKVVILAGGSGTRLWPVSRQINPKQVLPIIGKKTLLQQTYDRLCLGFDKEDIFIATGARCAREVRNQLPLALEKNIFVEPAPKDSAGAIGLAAFCVNRINPEEIIISAHSDSWIDNEKKFISQIKSASRVLNSSKCDTLVFGIKPVYPETGYGYIKANNKVVHCKRPKVFRVKNFIEKPDLKKARRIFSKSDVFWNMGWFAWRAGCLVSLYKKYLKKNSEILEKISLDYKTSRFQKTINKLFPKLDPISIDYGILEKTKNMLVFSPSGVRWSDIGTWRSVQEMSSKDLDGNFASSPSVLLDSAGNLLISKTGKFIASVGVENLIMVETKDSILLASKERAQDVKKITDNLKNSNFKKFL